MKEKEFNLTKEEKEYIINELISILDSCRYGGNQNLSIKNLMKLDDREFDIKEREFNIIKSICLKLKEKN